MDKGPDNWRQRTAFVGFDWASDHHDVVVVNPHGRIVEDFRFDDTAEGWQVLKRKLSKHPDVAVAIETSMGQPQSGEVSMGGGLLSEEARGRSNPRLRASLFRSALAEDPLEDVADTRAVRP